MAAIVASTLRRRTMQQKQYEWKLSTGETSLELMPPRTPSYYKTHPPSSPSGREKNRKNERIFIEDFWPDCDNPEEEDVRQLVFQSFETLVPRVNAWLRENSEIDILKCETVEKKIEHLDDLQSDSTMINLASDSQIALYVRGLRMWCIYRRHSHSTPSPCLTIGFLNVVPKCHDTSSTRPRYEELPETYAAINNYMIQKHLEGRILTIESLPLKLPSRSWKAPEVDPDVTYQAVEPVRKHHVIYITRIYFAYGPSQVELIGAQDFLPDYISKTHCNCACTVHPKYRPLVNAILKASTWIRQAQNIRIVNIQTLETIFKHNPEKVRTGRNFMLSYHRHCKVRFLRISYTSPPNISPPKSVTFFKEEEEEDEEDDDVVEIPGTQGHHRPTPATTRRSLEKNGNAGGGGEGRSQVDEVQPYYRTPSGLSYKTFMPSAVKIGMCTGSPEYEKFSSVWLRSKAWLQCIDRKVLNIETLYHPLKLAWNSQDCGETTSLCPNAAKEINVKMVQVIRVYLDGEYTEPSSDQLPILPPVEEVNDCYCCII